MLISEDYRQQNILLHKTKQIYGLGGGRWLKKVVKLIAKTQTADILDYGCGKGRLAAALSRMEEPLKIKEYDPAIPGKDSPPEPADIVICTDVLEHIEPECIDNVLDDLKRLIKKAGFLSIATVPASKELPDGRNAHLIIESREWWTNKIEERFEIKKKGKMKSTQRTTGITFIVGVKNV